MRKKIVLHIGAHKTGTTSIQQFFFENREQLKALGVLYPASCQHHFAQHRLAFALRTKRVPGTQDLPELASEGRALSEEIARSRCETVFVSSEEFFSLPQDRIAKLRDVLGGYQVQILAVLRRPDAMFASLYNQKAKEPRNRFFQPHVAFIDHPAKLSLDLRFDVALRNWSEVFGLDAVRTRCLEQYPNAVALASAAIGVEPARLKSAPTRSNVSVAVKTAEVVRMGKEAGLEASQLRTLRMVSSKLFGAARSSDSLLKPQQRMQILRGADAMTDLVFERYVRADNIYASSRFKESDFPPGTSLQAMDLMRVLSMVVPADPSG